MKMLTKALTCPASLPKSEEYFQGLGDGFRGWSTTLSSLRTFGYIFGFAKRLRRWNQFHFGATPSPTLA
jgi:hypothetical protein